VPEAMVAYLDNHGPEKFATIFLGKSKVIFFLLSEEKYALQFLIVKVEVRYFFIYKFFFL
jgi:hypothetical protein